MKGQDFWLEGERRCKVDGRVARQEMLCLVGVLKRVGQGADRGRFTCWSRWCAAERVPVDHVCRAEVNRARGERRSFKWLRN